MVKILEDKKILFIRNYEKMKFSYFKNSIKCNLYYLSQKHLNRELKSTFLSINNHILYSAKDYININVLREAYRAL